MVGGRAVHDPDGRVGWNPTSAGTCGLACGAVQRYFMELEAELPETCAQCGGETRHRCPECSAPFPSAFAVECEECGAEVRPPEVLGVRIRKPGR